MRLDRPRRGQQVAKLDQWRRSPPTLVGRALEHAVLVPNTQRADAARVIDRQEEVEGVQRTALDIRTGAPNLLPPFGVVAQDDAPRPAIRFGVRNRAVKEGSTTFFAMKLWARHQGEGGVDREAVRGR
jgi:hypothetical protein